MKFYTNVACQGNYIYYRGVENGRRVRLRQEYSPSLFLPSNTPSEWMDLHRNPLQEEKFASISEAREFIKKYQGIDGFNIYGNSRFEYSYITDHHPEENIEWSVDDVVVAYLDIEVGTEGGLPSVETCLNPVTAITIKFSNNPYYHVFACPTIYDSLTTQTFTTTRQDIHYHHCLSESDLLEEFLICWSENAPDVVTGWNVKTFDLPYLISRLASLPQFGEDQARKMSPWGRISVREEVFYNKPHRVFDILGVSTLDYMQLFRKYAPNASQESYKLDYIAHVELKERKLDYSEYDSLQHLYVQNFQKFIEYNIHDVELVERLNAKGRLIDMALTLAYDNKTNYEDVFSQVRMWDVICFNHLWRKKIIVPPKKEHQKLTAYEGAYVKEPQIGRFHWVSSFDLNSLYPHLIMQYNMSPETLIEPEQYTDDMATILKQPITVDALLEEKVDLSRLRGCTLTPNGQLFRTDIQGFLPEIMQKMYDARVVYKKKQLEAEQEKEQCTVPVRIKELVNLISRYKNLQLAKKVGLNSAYGAMGNEFFRFFDVRIAEGVTKAGQLSIRWIENRLNRYMNEVLTTNKIDYILASDTDSVYVNLGPLVKKVFPSTPGTKKCINWMDKACTKIQEVIDTSFKDLATYMHVYAQKMQMKRESLVDTAIWTAKKRYILNVWDSEGVRYAEPKIKIKGLEAIKSSTPSKCREKIKDALKVIMTGTEDDVIMFIEKFRVEFSQLPLHEIASPRSVNGLEDYRDSKAIYIKGTPMHVKGALIYNHFIKSRKLDQEYEVIRSGDKIKFIALKEPNILCSPVVAFPTRIPKEMGLEAMVDYRAQFEKSFVDPLRIILDAIGWHTEKQVTLEAFFS